MTDSQALAARLATDLDVHFPELVRTFQDRLYGFALRLLGNRQDAEESTQDAFVRAYRALERYPAEQASTLNLKAWLYRITLNVVRNRVRRPSLKLVELDSPVANGLASHVTEQPEVAAEAAERRDHLAQLIGELPTRYATAVVLRHVQGLSYVEAACVLDQPVGTTKSDVHRGLRLLRTAIEREPLLAAGEVTHA